jgi:hypothetical protein
MAQGGVAGDAFKTEVWLGSIDDRGKKKERKLAKAPFPEGMHDLEWQVLDVKDDASKALVLVTCNLVVKKPIKGLGDLPDLTVQYGRPATTVEGNMAILKYQGWSLWSFDANRGRVKQLTKLYAEKTDDLKKTTVGLEGKLGTFRSFSLGRHVAYSRQAAVVALSLNGQTVLKHDEEMLAPVVLIRVPDW